jgi:hypothetical protein
VHCGHGDAGASMAQELIDRAVSPGRPVFLFAKNYADSQELKRAHSIARDYIAKWGRLPGKR